MSQYATRAELADMGGLPAAVLATFTTGEQDAALQQASGVADTYLESNFSTPLTTPTLALKMHVCRMAASYLLRKRGYNPELGRDDVILRSEDDAMKWLEKVASGKIVLAGEVDATPAFDEWAPTVLSKEPRGW